MKPSITHLDLTPHHLTTVQLQVMLKRGIGADIIMILEATLFIG